MSDWSLAWLVLFIAGLALEMGALIRTRLVGPTAQEEGAPPRRGDGRTASTQVWALLRIPWLRPILWAAWAWLTWHFFL